MRNPANASTPTGFVLLVAFLVLLTIVAVIIIIVRAPSTADALTLVGVIFAFMAPLITAVLALFRAEKANGVAAATSHQLDQHVETVSGPPPANPGA